MITYRRAATILLWSSVGLLLVLLVFLGRTLPLAHLVVSLSEWLDTLGWWGPVVFILLCVAATLLFVPVVALALAAGVLFGLWTGVVLVSLAATLSAALTFLIARRFTQSTAQRWLRLRPRVTALEEAVVEGGWKVIALLRLSTLIPFSLLNYLYGLTQIGFWPYITVSWLAMLPGAFLYVYIGALTGDVLRGAHERSPAEWISLGFGLIATITASLYLTARANRKLRQRANARRHALADRISLRCLLAVV